MINASSISMASDASKISPMQVGSSYNGASPLDASMGHSNNSSMIVPLPSVTQVHRVKVPSKLLEEEFFSGAYPGNTKCHGYCNDLTKRKVAMVCALDRVSVRNEAGSELLPEWNLDGMQTRPAITRGRGFAIAEQITEPVVTDLCVVCCCVKLVLHMMNCRNSEAAVFTKNRVTVVWDNVFHVRGMFARYLTDDVDSKCGKISETSLEKVAHVCNGIRKKLTMNYRELIILS
jgi:hypothetical protein